MRVVLVLSAAASSLAPSAPIPLPAARGGARAVGAASACGKRSGGATHAPRTRARTAVPGVVGGGAAART